MRKIDIPPRINFSISFRLFVLVVGLGAIGFGWGLIWVIQEIGRVDSAVAYINHQRIIGKQQREADQVRTDAEIRGLACAIPAVLPPGESPYVDLLRKRYACPPYVRPKGKVPFAPSSITPPAPTPNPSASPIPNPSSPANGGSARPAAARSRPAPPAPPGAAPPGPARPTTPPGTHPTPPPSPTPRPTRTPGPSPRPTPAPPLPPLPTLPPLLPAPFTSALHTLLPGACRSLPVC
jgi:hypothetical protein